MFGNRYFGARYFGDRYFGEVEATTESGTQYRYFGARYYGVRYFGPGYFGGTGGDVPTSAATGTGTMAMAPSLAGVGLMTVSAVTGVGAMAMALTVTGASAAILSITGTGAMAMALSMRGYPPSTGVASAARIWLAELVAYNPITAATETLRVCSGLGFTTRPGETPANTYYEPRLVQPVDITRSIVSPGSTSGQTRVALGDVVIANPDGVLDDWIQYAFDGRSIVLYSGLQNAAYPAGFTREFVGTMDYPDFSTGNITIKLREYQREMAARVQVQNYGGTNVLPDGLDGVTEDLKGKAIPLVFGKVFNIAPPIVNTARLVYQVSGLAVETISAVYDRGTALAAGSLYANVVDMEANAPSAGYYRVLSTPTGTYFRLGSSPAGVITCDCEQFSSAPENETPAQLFSQLIALAGTNRGDSGLFDIASGDVATLDTLVSGVCGIYLDPSSEASFIEVLDQVAKTAGAWWGTNRAGEFRIQQIGAPSGTALFTFDPNVIVPPLQRISTRDEVGGIPSYQVTCRYARNYTVQAGDIAGAVTDARRAVIASEWREATYTDTAVQTQHLLAAALSDDSLFANEVDALAEAERRQGIRGKQRHRFDITTQLTDDVRDLDLGDVVALYHPRYGLNFIGSEEGHSFLIIGVNPNAKTNRVTFTLWGAAFDIYNRLFEDGTERLFEDGVYRLTEAG